MRRSLALRVVGLAMLSVLLGGRARERPRAARQRRCAAALRGLPARRRGRGGAVVRVRGHQRRHARSRARARPHPHRVAPVRWLLRLVGLAAWAWVVLQTIAGGSSDAEVASLLLWVFGWVGLALVSALLGPAVGLARPLQHASTTSLAAIVRPIGLRLPGRAPWHRRTGAWPAVAADGLLRVAGAGGAQVGGGRDLGFVLIGYTLLTLGGMAWYGKERWRAIGRGLQRLVRAAGTAGALGPGGPRRGWAGCSAAASAAPYRRSRGRPRCWSVVAVATGLGHLGRHLADPALLRPRRRAHFVIADASCWWASWPASPGLVAAGGTPGRA